MTYEQVAHFAKFGGTIFFFVFFVAVLVMVFLPGAKRKAEEAANVPLQDDYPIVDEINQQARINTETTKTGRT